MGAGQGDDGFDAAAKNESISERSYYIGSGGIVNHLVVERPNHSYSPGAVIEAQYRKLNGMISQCSPCRCVQNAEMLEQWEWVGDWIDKMPDETSHSLCESCWAYYYIYLSSRRVV